MASKSTISTYTAVEDRIFEVSGLCERLTGDLTIATNTLASTLPDVKAVISATDAYNTAVDTIGAPKLNVNKAVSDIIGKKVQAVIDECDNTIGMAKNIRYQCEQIVPAPATTPAPASTLELRKRISCKYTWKCDHIDNTVNFDWSSERSRYVLHPDCKKGLVISSYLRDDYYYNNTRGTKRILVVDYHINGNPVRVRFYTFTSDGMPIFDGESSKFN